MCQRVSVTQRLIAAGRSAPAPNREKEKPSNSITKASATNFGTPSTAVGSEPPSYLQVPFMELLIASLPRA